MMTIFLQHETKEHSITFQKVNNDLQKAHIITYDSKEAAKTQDYEKTVPVGMDKWIEDYLLPRYIFRESKGKVVDRVFESIEAASTLVKLGFNFKQR